LFVHTAGAVDGYTLPVHTADDAKEYTPHVLNAGGGKGMQPAYQQGMRREGSLQLFHMKSMPLKNQIRLFRHKNIFLLIFYFSAIYKV
jgi:hypothetical protein